MGITAKNIVKHELIGLHAKVSACTNTVLLGIEGIVVDETKNMLIIETDVGDKKIQKAGAQFIFKLPDGKRVKVDGNLIVGKPEDRLKIKLRRV